jgi:hypothetical protein
MWRFGLGLALALAVACGGRRQVADSRSRAGTSSPPRARPTESAPAPAAQPAAPAAAPDLDSLSAPDQSAERRAAFASAVAAISQQVGQPIAGEKALADMPCGGWSGSECANLTVGIEIARTCAPIVASFHRKKTAEIAGVLARAVSIHSVWHDAYGYVWKTTGKGPGYTYAGCLFSECDPGDLRSGQVDGILYQVGRLIGTTQGPACGPACTLAAGD